MVDVTVSYLEMTSPAQLRPAARVPPGIAVGRVVVDAAQVASELYRDVGGPWHWRDRLAWSLSQWEGAIDRPGIELWVAAREADGERVGYFELEQIDDAANIHYFGLVARFIGQGIGGWLLTRAVERAWELGVRRVTLNTCTLDGEAALPNYRARGFVVVRTVHQRRELPDEPR